jgi:hypothetical protein
MDVGIDPEDRAGIATTLLVAGPLLQLLHECQVRLAITLY